LLTINSVLYGGTQFVVMQSYQNKNRYHYFSVNVNGDVDVDEAADGIKFSEPALLIFSEICH
jgi:hypothetical protein